MSIVLQGSTSGSVTLQEPAVAGTTVLTLPAVTGNVLTDTSPKAGNVIQVVSATYSTAVSIASSSYTDTGLQASITPTSSSSKILILVNQAGGLRLNSTSEQSGYANLVRGATQITEIIQIQRMGATASQYAPYFNGIVFLDSPATTSSTTYKTQAKVAVTADTGVLYFQVNSLDSTITLMEIAA
jgi:hypothetical protein